MNQVEKFGRKWSKNRQDLQAIRETELRKQQTEAEQNLGFVNGEEFKQETGLKEIVAGFTREGMNVFATLFSNSVEGVVREQLPNIIKPVLQDVIRQELQNVLLFATEELRNFTQQSTRQIINHVVEESVAEVIKEQVTNVQETVQESMFVVESDANNQDKKIVDKNIVKKDSITTARDAIKKKSEKEMQDLCKLLKNSTKPLTAREIADKMTKLGYAWASPYAKILLFTKKNPSIRKSQFGGSYEFVEAINEVSATAEEFQTHVEV